MPFKPGQSGNPDAQFKPGQSGNPAGQAKGTIHLSTHIQNMLNEEVFDPETKVGKAPIKAIIEVAVQKASQGDKDSREWLAKYGYGQKYEVAHSGEIATGSSDEKLAAEFSEFLKKSTK